MKRHTSIKTLPVAVFQEILETGNVSLLGRGSKESDWAAIFDEYISAFDVSGNYKSYIMHMTRMCKLYKQAYLEGKMWLLSVAEVERRKAMEYVSDKKGASFASVVAQVSKGMGFRVDPNSTSVLEFYSYVKLLENGNGKG